MVAAYDNATFDAVVCSEMIEHVYLPRVLVQSAFELLRQGGLFGVTTPYNGYLKNSALCNILEYGSPLVCVVGWGHIKFLLQKTIR